MFFISLSAFLITDLEEEISHGVSRQSLSEIYNPPFLGKQQMHLGWHLMTWFYFHYVYFQNDHHDGDLQ